MASEDFVIRIILDAQSKIAPVMEAAALEADKLRDRFKGADKAAKDLDVRLTQLDGHLVKARDTLRSINPTLEALDRKSKGLSVTLTGVNRNMGVLERQSAKAGAALGQLAGLADKIEKKLAQLDRKMTEMGARKYEPKIDVDTKKSEAQVDALSKKLLSLERKRRTVRIGIEQEILDREIAETQGKLAKLDRDRVIKLHVALDDEGERLLDDKAREQTRKFQDEQDKQVASRKKAAADWLADTRKAIDEIENVEKKHSADAIDREAELEARRHVGLLNQEKRNRESLRKQLDDTLATARASANEPISYKALLDTKSFNREYDEALAKLLSLAGIDVKPGVHLGTAEFELERKKVEAQLLELGLKREHVKVVLDYDRNNFQRAAQDIQNKFEKIADFADDKFKLTLRTVTTFALNVAVIFSGPLLSALTAVGGALVAVGVAAGQAAIGLAGLAAAAVAQAIPVVGLLALAFSRVAAVLKVAQLAQQERDKASTQGAAVDNQHANALDALRTAHEGVANAQRAVTDAQDKLNDARRQGVRDLTDLILAEQKSNLTAQQSQLSLARSIASGSSSGLISAQQLQARGDQIDANRQRVDTGRAVAGGVSGLPNVVAAKRGVEDAARALTAANRQVEQAQRGLDVAADKMGAAANAYETALGKLSRGERVLLRSVESFKKIFSDIDGPVRKASDTILVSFAGALDRLRILFSDPKIVAAFQGLADKIASIVSELAKFFTSGPMRDALVFFTDQAKKNLGPVADIFENLVTIFKDVARAASGPLGSALRAVDGFLRNIADRTSSKKGQSDLADFFNEALKPISAFLDLALSVLNLFLALAGPGGATDEGTRGIEDLAKEINKATEYVKEHGKEVHKFFHDSIDATGDVLKVVLAVGRALVKTFDKKSVHEFTDFLTEVVIPVLATFIKTLDIFVKGLLGIANTPGGKFLLTVAAFAGSFGIIATRLLGLFKPLGTLVGGIATSAGKIKTAFLWLAERLPFINGLLKTTKTEIAEADAGNFAAGPAGAARSGAASTVARDAEKVGAGAAAGRGAALLARAKPLLRGAGKLGVAAAAADVVVNLVDSKGNPIAAAINSAHDMTFGLIPKVDAQAGAKKNLDDFQKKIQDLASAGNVKGLQDLRKEFDGFSHFDGEPIDKARKQIDAFIQTAEQNNLKRKFGGDLDEVSKAVKRASDRFLEWRRDGGDSIHDLRVTIGENLKDIRDHLGSDTAAGKEAAEKNFQAAAQSIQDAMDAGQLSAKKGLKEIERLMRRSLAVFGIKGNAADRYLNDQDTLTGKTIGGGTGQATGGFAGWVGKQGERGQDMIHTVLGRGEAVLNWAQQKVVNPALQATYGFGLSEMFNRTRATHAGVAGAGYATGGRVGANDIYGGHPSNVIPGITSLIKNILGKFPGMHVSDTTDHAVRTTTGGISDHVSGHAVDIAGAIPLMNTVVAYIKSSGIAGRLKQGIHNPGLSINAGKTVPTAFWGAAWPQHIDHIHLALAGALGKIKNLAGDATIKRVKATGVDGAFGQLVQRGLDVNRQAAIDRIRDAASATGLDTGTGSGSSFVSTGFTGPWVSRMSQIAKSNNWSLGDWRSLVQGESGGDPTARNKSSGAFGLGQFLGDTARTYAKYGSLSTNPIKQIEAMAKYIADRYGNPSNAYHTWLSRDPHWYAGGGIVGGKTPQWGGWHQNGLTTTVNRPTLFGAGENGPEVVSIAPQPNTTSANRLGDPLKLLAQLLGTIGFGAVGDIQSAVSAVNSSVKRLAARGKKSLNRLSTVLDFLTSDETSPFVILEQAIADNAAKLARKVQESVFKVKRNKDGSFTAVRGITDPQVLGTAEISNLEATRRSTQSELGSTNTLLDAARKGLSGAKNDKETQRFKGEINRLLAQREKIQQSLADNAQSIVERQEQMQTDLVDSTNQIFDNQRAAIDRAVRIFDAMGIGSGGGPGVFDQRISIAQSQIAALAKLRDQAGSKRNFTLADQIQDQIDELNTSIVELTAAKFQSMIQAVNDQAASGLRQADLTQRLANIGGHTNFALAQTGLQQKGDALVAQRAGLLDLINGLWVMGARGAPIFALADQIHDLDVGIVENTQAIKDNTDAAFNYSVQQSQQSSDFFLGINDAATAINNSLGALTGVTDTTTQASILNERGGMLANRSSSDRGFLSSLLNSVMPGLVNAGTLQSASGNALAPLLQGLSQGALNSGLFDDTQMQTIRDLVNAILHDEQATIDNTKALKDVGVSLTQSFTSTAWMQFRKAIFDGANGVLPQYASLIPHAATGGWVVNSGAAYVHSGEEIVPVGSRSSMSDGDTYHLNVTTPTEVLDPQSVSQQLAFYKRTRGR